jgi:hypothetical protein
MNAGRWYPTNTTLPNGDVLILGARSLRRRQMTFLITVPNQYAAHSNFCEEPAVEVVPMMFVAPDGRVFHAGRLPRSHLNTSGTGLDHSRQHEVRIVRESGFSVM